MKEPLFLHSAEPLDRIVGGLAGLQLAMLEGGVLPLDLELEIELFDELVPDRLQCLIVKVSVIRILENDARVVRVLGLAPALKHDAVARRVEGILHDVDVAGERGLPAELDCNLVARVYRLAGLPGCSEHERGRRV